MPEEFLVTVKVSGSEFLWDAVDAASQMLGGRGYLDNNEIAKILRDARVGRVFEGPTETMMHYMGSRFVLDGEKLTVFLQTHLNAQDIVEQMIEAKDIVATRCKAMAAPYAGMQKLHLANFLLGEIIHWGILYAVSRHLEDAVPTDGSRVKYWTQGKFKEIVEAAKTSSIGEETTIEPGELKNLVGGFGAQIGDMEQTLPGEEWGLDPYLRVAN